MLKFVDLEFSYLKLPYVVKGIKSEKKEKEKEKVN